MRAAQALMLAALFCLSISAAAARREVTNVKNTQKDRMSRLEALTGDEDFNDEQAAWDRTYSRQGYVFGKAPADFLSKNVESLPKGRALDIASGEGRNAVFLAKKGFRVEAVDISAVGLRKAQRLAEENGVKIQTVNADLNKYKILPGHYTVILNFYYLQRNLFPQIKAGLKKGGVLVFEANTTDQLKLKSEGTWEREFLLEPGELKKAFADLEILHYSETNDGKNAIASLIARKK